MKIWFAASVAQSSCGGVSRSMMQFSRYLRNAGMQVEIIFASKKGDNYLKFSLSLALRLLKNLADPPDWIIARSSDSVFCAVLIRIFSLKTRIALHNHGWEEKVYQTEKRLPKRIITNPTGWKAQLVRFPLLKANLFLSDICICGTIEEARWIAARYRSSVGKLKVIPNGIEVPRKPYWPLQENFPLNLLSIGGFTWKKNLEYSLQLFRKVLGERHDSRLILVGTGKITEEKRQLLDFPGNSLTIIEKESPENMFRWYETCPFLISSSRYEGGRAFGILEAMARGCVVFATGIPSTKEIIRDKQNGILLTGTGPESDVSAILKLYENIEQIKRIGVSAWKYAKRNRIERQVKRMARVLQE